MNETRRPYPAWWVARSKERRAILAGAVERLRAIVAVDASIVAALVFGSFARNEVGPESDLDIMIVTSIDANGDAGLRYARIVERLDLGVPYDLLVYGVEQFELLKATRNFVARAVREGIWIDATTPA